jgi:hypothetical protein
LNGFLLNSGFPVGLNGRKYRFFHVGDALGGAFGDAFYGVQKRNVLKGGAFGGAQSYTFYVD